VEKIVMVVQELVLSAGKEANQNNQKINKIKNDDDDDDDGAHTGREWK